MASLSALFWLSVALFGLKIGWKLPEIFDFKNVNSLKNTMYITSENMNIFDRLLASRGFWIYFEFTAQTACLEKNCYQAIFKIEKVVFPTAEWYHSGRDFLGREHSGRLCYGRDHSGRVCSGRKHSGRFCFGREHSGEKVSGEFSSGGFVLGENIRGECEKGESSLKGLDEI